jgi:protein-tyrosine phosphatase
VEYLLIDIEDAESENMQQHFDACHAFLSKAQALPNGVALVHCAAGISRSTTIVLSHFLLRDDLGLSLREAFRVVKRGRHVVWHNEAFMQQLMGLEEQRRGGSSTISLTEYTRWEVDYEKKREEQRSSLS